MKNENVKFEQKDKSQRFIGAVILCVAVLCTIFGDKNNNLIIIKIGKIAAVVGIIIYFWDRIERFLQKHL